MKHTHLMGTPLGVYDRDVSVMTKEDPKSKSVSADNKPPMWDFVYDTAMSVHGIGEASAEKYADDWSDPYGIEPERPSDWLKFTPRWNKVSPELYGCGRPKNVNKDVHHRVRQKMYRLAKDDLKSDDMPSVVIPWREVKSTCMHQYPSTRWLVEPSDEADEDEPYFTDEEPDKDDDDVKTVMSLDDAVKNTQSGADRTSLPEFPSYLPRLSSADDPEAAKTEVVKAWMGHVEWMMPDVFAGASIELVGEDEVSVWG